MRFQEILDGVEKTRQEVLSEIKRKKDEKKKILEEQLNIIHSEKNKVDADVKVTNRFRLESYNYSHSLIQLTGYLFVPCYMPFILSILGNTKSSRGSSNYKEDIGSEL